MPEMNKGELVLTPSGQEMPEKNIRMTVDKLPVCDQQ